MKYQVIAFGYVIRLTGHTRDGLQEPLRNLVREDGYRQLAVKHTSFIRCTLASLVLALAGATIGCRAVPERSAQAQVRGQASFGEEVAVRRVWSGNQNDFYQMDISPNGQYLLLIDWSTLNLAVFDIETSMMHAVTEGAGGDEVKWELAGVSAFSRDGGRLAYSWDRSAGPMQLRVIEFDPNTSGRPWGRHPIIHEVPQFAPYYVFDWSPDGRDVLVLGYPDGNTAQLVLISTGDGTRRVLESFDWREPLLAEFSPDGNYIAYDFLPSADSPNRDVKVVSVDGAQAVRVVEHAAADRFLGWESENRILFYSDRGDTPGVWGLPMADGRAAGAPELLKGEMWDMEPIGVADGRLFYGISVNPAQFYTASIDLESGLLTTAPVAMDDPNQLSVRAWDWSSDGEFLAYAGSIGGQRAAQFGRGRTMIVVRADDGGEVKRMRLDMGRPSRLRWAPDGSSLLVWARDTRGRRAFQRIDLSTGTHETILRGGELGDPPLAGHFTVSPDGTKLWFARRNVQSVDEYMTLVEYDLAALTFRTISAIESTDEGFVAVSPDGSRLAIVAPASPRGAIGTVPVDGGPVTPLFQLPADTRVMELDWTQDGMALVFSTLLQSEPSGQWKTWVLAVDGRNEPKQLQLPPYVSPRELSLRPDGGRIGFLAGETRGEVWVMEGLGMSAGMVSTGGSR